MQQALNHNIQAQESVLISDNEYQTLIYTENLICCFIYAPKPSYDKVMGLWPGIGENLSTLPSDYFLICTEGFS